MNNEIKLKAEAILAEIAESDHSDPLDIAAVCRAYLQEREWISVEDRLPENEDHVAVITTEHPNPVTGWYIKDEGWLVSKGEFDSIGEGFFSDESIKYWSPLPPEPEQ